MAWLIIRVCDDRQGKHTVNVLKKRSKLGDPKTSDVVQLAEKHGIEIHASFKPPPRREWPWSVVAYTSPSWDGIGRARGQYIHLVARPRRREAQLRGRGQ